MVVNEDTIEDLCEEWVRVSDKLKALKVAEMEMRKELVNFIAPDGVVGVHKRNFNAFTVKATLKLNYKFDEPLLELLYDSMSDAEKEAVKYKPGLSLTQYKKINEDNRNKLDDCLIVTPAAPSFGLEYRGQDD